jgi:hypothetical protein
MKLKALLISFLCAVSLNALAQTVTTSTSVDASVVTPTSVDASVAVLADASVADSGVSEIAAVVTSTSGPSLLFKSEGFLASVIAFLVITILGLVWKRYSKKPFPIKVVNAGKAPEAPSSGASETSKQDKV